MDANFELILKKAVNFRVLYAKKYAGLRKGHYRQ